MSRVLVVGRGRMGRLVESLAADYGFEVAGRIDRAAASGDADWPAADVAIDFSTPDAVPENLPRLAARGVPKVIGTTGWQAHEEALRANAAVRQIGVVAAPNFALGVNIFLALANAGALLAGQASFGARIHRRITRRSGTLRPGRRSRSTRH